LIGSVTASASGIRAFLGAYENDRLGESLAVGDINGDGFQDLFLGADHQDVLPTPNSTRLDVGRVHLFYGGQFLSGPDYTPVNLRTTADYRFIGRGEFDLHGDSIQLFNWNGDTNPVTGRGLDDLWISAPYAEWSSVGSTDDDRGLVSMIPGSGTVFAATAHADVTFPTLADHVLVGPLAETLFGGRMEFGELLSDPGTEMAVTASRYYAGGGLSTGLVFVLTHPEADLGTPASPLYTENLLKTAGAFRSVIIPGEAQGDRFGLRTKLLSRGGGVSLLAVGAPDASIFARAAVGVTYLLNVDSMAFDPNAGPTPTLQPTLTITPTPLATATPSPTGVPSIFDVNSDGVLDPLDLLEFSGDWMNPGKDTLPSNPWTLMGMIESLRGAP
jgi:hypothetical protein